MEQLSYQQTGTGYYNFDIYYSCPKCGHDYAKASSIPFKCDGCKCALNNVRTLIIKTNQDIRVKHYAGKSV